MDEKFKLKYISYNRSVHWMYDIYNRYFRTFFQSSIPLTNDEDFAPFFIVGSGRSGNTLLRRVLTANEGVVIPPETYVFGKIFRLHYTHKNLKWPDYVNLIISTFEYHSQFFTFDIDSLSDLALELKKLRENKRSLACIINRFYTFYAEQKGLSLDRWGDKTPLNAMYAYRIKKLFPKAQFIHIVRDGVDVTYSYVKANLYEDYETAAIRWKKSVQFLKKFGEKYPESYFEIKYEKLVTETEFSVKEICDFLGMEFQKEMISLNQDIETLGDVKYLGHHHNIFNEINTKSIGKGRKKLTSDDLAKIKPIVDLLLEQLGYDKIPA